MISHGIRFCINNLLVQREYNMNVVWKLPSTADKTVGNNTTHTHTHTQILYTHTKNETKGNT
jgi:hypothetical protein